MQLEAYIPSHRTLTLGRDILENFHVELALVVYNRNAGAVHKAYSRAISETCETQEHGQGHERPGHDLNEAVVGECLRKQMLPVNTHTSQIIVFEVSVRIEVEADQDCDDLGIRHHALSAPLRSISGTRKCVFCHLDLKFLAEIVRDTKNFSNFTLGNHDTVFTV